MPSSLCCPQLINNTTSSHYYRYPSRLEVAAAAVTEDIDDVMDMAEAAVVKGMNADEFDSLMRSSFAEADSDGSGTLDRKEMKTLLGMHSGLSLSAPEMRSVYKSMDNDGDGSVNYSEFIPIMFDILVSAKAQEVAAEAASLVADADGQAGIDLDLPLRVLDRLIAFPGDTPARFEGRAVQRYEHGVTKTKAVASVTAVGLGHGGTAAPDADEHQEGMCSYLCSLLFLLLLDVCL